MISYSPVNNDSNWSCLCKDSHWRHLRDQSVNGLILKEAADERAVFDPERGEPFALNNPAFANGDDLFHGHNDAKPTVELPFNIFIELSLQLLFHFWTKELGVKQHFMVQIFLLKRRK